jgi:signal transduction histidine kinase
MTPANILVVEDEAASVMEIRCSLEELGYTVVGIASTGEKALQKAADSVPDLVMMDVRLDGVMNGITAAEKLRERFGVPIIYLTAYVDEDTLLRARTTEPFGYLLKPFEDRLLYTTIEMALYKHQIEQQLRQYAADLEHTNQRLEQEIAERTRIQEEIRAINSELEQRVQRRTAQLKATNDELKNFAYIVSHDLKAPLRGITQVANWLAQDYAEVVDSKGQKMLDLLSDRVKRMRGLIDGVLRYSRAGHAEEEQESLDLSLLLGEIVDSLAPPDHIAFDIQPELPTIVADRTVIIQIFQNLLSNAIKFIDKPQGRIRIGCDDESKHWRFSVADNGTGVEPRNQDRVFHIFQTYPSQSPSESTGIGLAIVKKLVESYHGKIWLESTVGEGTTFFFTLPKTQ